MQMESELQMAYWVLDKCRRSYIQAQAGKDIPKQIKK